MKFIPKIVYGSGPTTLTLTTPSKLWSPKAKAIGGGAVSDAGVPESFIVRRDQLCKVEFRFFESEWVAVDTWLAFAQTASAFDFYFDKDVSGTKYTVYMDDPAPGTGDVAPTRDTYTKVFTMPIVIRTTDGSRFDVRIF